MKRAVVLFFLTTIAATTIAAERSRFVVGVKPEWQAPGAKFRAIALAAKGDASERNLRRFEKLDGFALDLTAAEAAALRRNDQVLFVDPVIEREITSDDRPQFGRPVLNIDFVRQTIGWGVDAVNAREVWPYSRGEGVNVVVVDTGIDTHHPDLAPNYAGGYNTYTRTNDPTDDHYHGTHVSGIIGAADNGFGTVGVAPKVRLWAVKALAKNGFGSDENIAAAIDWAIAKKEELGGNWIMNFSLGSIFPSRFEAAAVLRGDDAGILMIAAAGNRAIPQVDYPGGYPGGVPIGAVDAASERAEFASYGAGLQLSAPGVGVPSTVPVDSIDYAEVLLENGTTFKAWAHNGGPLGDATGKLVYCNLGNPEDFPAEVRGNIALIRRGQIQFRVKARNAKAAGAAGVIVYNNQEFEDMEFWTFLACGADGTEPCDEDKGFAFPLTVGVSMRDGERLLEQAGKVGAGITHRMDDYLVANGTSMASPHAAGVAALLWSLAPNATNEQIRLAMKLSAKDLGTVGWDMNYGYGMINALAAAKLLAPQRFGLPPA
ncbi:MAG TPA: S8 family serine peptidase, partial [Thermoanaerobaculia bacterium]